MQDGSALFSEFLKGYRKKVCKKVRVLLFNPQILLYVSCKCIGNFIVSWNRLLTAINRVVVNVMSSTMPVQGTPIFSQNFYQRCAFHRAISFTP